MIMVKVYALENYNITIEEINKNYEEYNPKKLSEILMKKDKGYHERISSNKKYKLFGDLDEYSESIDTFFDIFINYMKTRYDVNIIKGDIHYTQNKKHKNESLN